MKKFIPQTIINEISKSIRISITDIARKCDVCDIDVINIFKNKYKNEN